MSDIDKEIKKLKDTDPLHVAEQITGKSYKEDEGTEKLGFGLHLAKVAEMNRLMEETGDVSFGSNTEDYKKTIEKAGFKKIYRETFIGKSVMDKKEIEEEYFIYYHADLGLLIDFDTYNQDSINGGKLYYNILFKDRAQIETSSGNYVGYGKEAFDKNGKRYILEDHIGLEPRWTGDEWEDFKTKRDKWQDDRKKFMEDNDLYWVWSGDHDARQALLHTIRLLNGEEHRTLDKWVENPIFSLTNYMDWKEGKSDENSITRWNKLPESLRNLLGTPRFMETKKTKK